MSDPRNERTIAYLLGELEQPEADAFERELRDDAALRDELARMQAVTTKLEQLPSEGWEAEPPALALPVAELPRSPAATATTGWRRRSWWSPARTALAGACAAVLVAAGIGIGVLIADDGAQPGATRSVDLKPLEPGGPQASAVLTLGERDPKTAELTVSGLPDSGSGYYELWLLGDRETVSLGSFKVGANGEAKATVSLPVDPQSYRSFDISIEPADGDPEHSGNSVLRAPART
jgi:anti-sigma-K factor RskA